jgi:signal transduction histidine kinase
LHDSVLQTLALIQRQAGDPQRVTQLARTQERELRTWLFESTPTEGATLRTSLQRIVSEVEASHQVPIELVVVGDAPLDDPVGAIVKASREAIVNAAKHSGAERIDVFAEVQLDAIEVGVRDRGRGFDPSNIAPDRRGVRGSIIDRLARHGGRADVRSGLGYGTDLRMTVPLRNQEGEA